MSLIVWGGGWVGGGGGGGGCGPGGSDVLTTVLALLGGRGSIKYHFPPRSYCVACATNGRGAELHHHCTMWKCRYRKKTEMSHGYARWGDCTGGRSGQTFGQDTGTQH